MRRGTDRDRQTDTQTHTHTQKERQTDGRDQYVFPIGYASREM